MSKFNIVIQTLDNNIFSLQHSTITHRNSVLNSDLFIRVYFPISNYLFSKKPLSLHELIQQISTTKVNPNPSLEAKTATVKNIKNDPSLGRYSKFSTPR
jgi:hypothetical protein